MLAGRIHQYGDQRLPLPGAAGTVAAAAAAISAGMAGHAAAATLAGAAFVALLGWLGLSLRIAAPINRRMTKAARDHNPRSAARQRDGTADRDTHQLIKPRPGPRGPGITTAPPPPTTLPPKGEHPL